MNKKPAIVLTGNDLSFRDIVAIGIGDKRVELDKTALERCRASRRVLDRAVKEKKVIYGVNTSFGPMCNKIIDNREIEVLQNNLILSHSAGLGAPILPYIALGIFAVRLNTLVKGYSGVRGRLLELMRDLINNGIAPFIPECGSVGASGDLTHLAHLSLAIIGKGTVYLNRKLVSASEAFEKTGLTPLALSYKEGLALMNGTAAMTGIAAFTLFGADKLLNIACVNAAFAIEIFGGIDDAFDSDLHR
ncbi:MAG: aromatic amino acid lyase, partial [Thermodesulfobacteriota bacterium]